MKTTAPEDTDSRETDAECRSEEAATARRDGDIEATVDQLIEVYEELAGLAVSPGPCPMCKSQPAGRCPTLATMNEIREFIADRRPNRLCELFE